MFGQVELDIIVRLNSAHGLPAGLLKFMHWVADDNDKELWRLCCKRADVSLWVSTSIAVMVFAFLVEHFDPFLAFAAPEAVKDRITVARSEFGHVDGLVLITLGIVLIVLSAKPRLRVHRIAPQ